MKPLLRESQLGSRSYGSRGSEAIPTGVAARKPLLRELRLGSRVSLLSQYLVYHLAVDVGEAKIATLETVSQLFVVNTE